jgi:hypothetical protein
MKASAPGTAASTFSTGSQVGDTYTVNGGDGSYFIVEGAGDEFITINGSGNNNIMIGFGIDNVKITGTGDNTISAGTSAAGITITGFSGSLTGSAPSPSPGATITVTGADTGSATIGGNSTLEIANGATFVGPINFGATSGGTLKIDGTTMPTGTIHGFAVGDTVQLDTVPYDASTEYTVFENNNSLEVVEAGKSYVLQFDSGQNFTGSFQLSAASDGSTDVRLNSQPSGGYSVTPGNSIANPYSAVVLISVPGQSSGTGFIIGPHTILTAAHVAQPIGSSTDATVYLDTNGGLGTSIPIDPNYVHIDSTWSLPLSPPLPPYDLAIIDVKQNLTSYGQFSLAPGYAGGTVNITGYPESAPGLAQYNGITSVSPILSTLLESPVISEHGDSGGPLWTSNGMTFTAVGLVSGVSDLLLSNGDIAEINSWIAGDSSLWSSSVSDGYISGATVFADANGTGQLASNDASTATDANGNFTLTGGAGPLYAFGGTDTSTGLPFKGHLEAPAGSTVIDPLTTLVSGLQANAGLSLAAAQQEVLTALGLSSSINLTTLDPIAGVNSGDATSAAAYIAGTKVIDTVEMIATTMTGAGVSFSKAFADVFAALDAKINALPAGQTLNLSDQTTVAALINSVAQTESVHLPSAEAATIAASNALLDQALAKDGASPALLTDAATTQLAALTTPIAVPDFAHATFGTTIHVAAAGVLANDVPGVTGDTLTVGAVDGLSQNVGTTVAGAYGTLTLDADGSYAYKASGHSPLPLTGVSEDFFGYTAHGSASSTLTVVVTFPGLAYVAAPVGGSATQSNGLHYAVLDGSAGNATLHAVNGLGAALVGGNGDTLDLANIGVDTVVAMGNFGQITVNNYKANGLLAFDVIQLSKSDFGTNPAAIAHDATQAHGSPNTVITDPVNHDTITLAGVSLSSLHFDAGHFLLA